MKVKSHLDIVLNSILNVVLDPLSADPATPTAGRVYYNTTTKKIRYADGAAWNNFSTDLTPQEALALLVQVDGTGSGLDADLLDGLEASAFALASHSHTANDISDFAQAVDGRIMAAFTNDAVDATVDTIQEFTALIKANQGELASVLSAKRFSQTIGDDNATDITVTHNLNSLDALVQIVEVASGETVLTDVARNGANSVVVSFSEAPSVEEFRVIILA